MGPGGVDAPTGNADRLQMALPGRLSRGRSRPLAHPRPAVAHWAVRNDHQLAVEALYREAVTVAERARRWFDGPGATWRATLDTAEQALVATESLATTARLLAIIAWTLDPRQATAMPAFVQSDTDTSVAPPLLGTPGGDLAAAARRLTARAVALTAEAQPLPPPAADSWRLS